MIVHDRNEISKVIEELYTKVYSPHTQQPIERTIRNTSIEEILEIINLNKNDFRPTKKQ